EMTRLSLFPRTAPAHPARGMGQGDPDWAPATWALMIAMWGTMMVAMMGPSAAPAILLYGRVRRRAEAQGQGSGVGPTGAFAAAYLVVWLAFAVCAALAQWTLQPTGLLSAEAMASQSRWLSAALLAAAGLYQLSPLHSGCLNQCRSPAQFLSRHWRPGLGGAVRLGL